MRVLVTGASGVVGSEVVDLLGRELPDADVVGVVRRRPLPSSWQWSMGEQPAPEALEGHWDVIVHTAASTRWSMTREEAERANLLPLRAALALADADTHVVQLSTAYAEGAREGDDPVVSEFGRHRNAYEWSKGVSEEILADTHRGPLTILRPPLIVGSRRDGAIAKLTGPYTLVQGLVSGLAAAVVGSPNGYAEFAPVDQVAECVLDAVRGDLPADGRPCTIAAGEAAVTLGALLDIVFDTVNGWRDEHGVAPLDRPPIIDARRWHRFYLPFATEHFSEVQLAIIRLLQTFESYTSLGLPLVPDVVVDDPAGVLRTSIRAWADRKPALAARVPEQWASV